MAHNARAKILLVEDHPDTAHVVRFILEQHGYDVRHARSCTDACAVADGAQLDLLICDIGLPDGNGVDLLRMICLNRSLPAIAVSGYGTEEDIRRSLEAGFLAHLTKPFSVDALLQTIDRALS
jgi:DNA-binding response OmpR family regulator